MRDIKFRVWIPQTKLMEYDIPMFGDSNILFKRLNHEDVEYIVMQYIVLHDKNGKEIYEGDICESDLMFSNNKIRGVIEYHGLCFKLKTKDDIYISPFSIKILGNIYENQELLE